MDKTVTVNLDDLEKLVMATGFVKELEKVIYQHKKDPFVCKTKIP